MTMFVCFLNYRESNIILLPDRMRYSEQHVLEHVIGVDMNCGIMFFIGTPLGTAKPLGMAGATTSVHLPPPHPSRPI